MKQLSICFVMFSAVLHGVNTAHLELLSSYLMHVNSDDIAQRYEVTPKQFIIKSQGRKLTEHDVRNYVIHRLVHRVQHRLQQVEQQTETASSEYYQHLVEACMHHLISNAGRAKTHDVQDDTGSAVLSALLPGGVHLSHMNGAAGLFSHARRSIALNPRCVYQAPFLCLFVIEHEITHAEQFCNGQRIYNRWRRRYDLRPIDMQFVDPEYTLRSDNMDPCEYDADYQATQFTPYPYAVWCVVQLPGAKDGSVRDTQYPSKERISRWLRDRSYANFSLHERDHEKNMVRGYGYTPFNLQHIGSGVTTLASIVYAAMYSVDSSHSWLPAVAVAGGVSLYNTMWAPCALRPLWRWWINNIETVPLSSVTRIFDYATSAYSACRDATHRYKHMIDHVYRTTFVPDAHRSMRELIRSLSIDIAPNDPYIPSQRIICERDIERIAYNEVYRRCNMHDMEQARRHIKAVACDQEGVVEIIPREKTRELDDL